MVCCSLFLGEGRGVDNRLHYFSPCSTLPSGFLNLDAQGSVSVGNRGHAARMRRHIAPSVSCVDVAPPPLFFHTRLTLASPVNYSCTGCERLAHSSPATCWSLVMNPALVGETLSGRAVQIPGS